jgi:hypothetical protein
MPYKNPKDRKYKNAAKYEAQPEQVAHRVARNAARRKLMKAGKVRKGDGKDVAHVVALDKGGSNKDGLRVESKSTNRSFKRDSKRNLVSETSKRERKLKK